MGNFNAGGSVYEGSISGRFGNRKPPSSAYATPSPIFHYDDDEELFIGGNFWDGRATGEKLGNPAADQAQGPFLNSLEQALPDSACVVYRVCNSAAYPGALEDVYGNNVCDINFPADTNALCAAGSSVSLAEAERAKSNAAYDNIALAIAAYEGSSESNAYTSKYDYFLQGKVKLTKQERKGLNLFKGKGKCANCHTLDEGPNGEPPLLTDFTFDNLGLPRNPENPFYTQAAFKPDGDEWIDFGLGKFLLSRPEYAALAAQNDGKQKVPTLRNVDKRPKPMFVKAFGHNGYFKSLKGIVHFYNTRDVKPACQNDPQTAVDESKFLSEAQALEKDCWPEPEVDRNVNDEELGNLHLSGKQEDAIVAFLKTLSDGYVLPASKK
ncbi:MAG: cytochrome-c peroxidase [Gammaproteobacteria bacterium]